jgi:hypothetical protein
MCVLVLFCLLHLSCNCGPLAIFVIGCLHDRSLHQWMLLNGCLIERVALVSNRVMLVRGPVSADAIVVAQGWTPNIADCCVILCHSVS